MITDETLINPNNKMINGELCVYCDEDNNWYPKFKDVNGVKMELDEKYFIYVLEGDSIDESRERMKEFKYSDNDDIPF